MKSFNKIHYRPLFLLLFLSYFTISMNSCKEDIDDSSLYTFTGEMMIDHLVMVSPIKVL